jgi:hypothetical protein
MQEAFSVEVVGLSKEPLIMGGKPLIPGSRPGIVEKTVGPGKYLVTLRDGKQVTVYGPRSIKIGNNVQVLTRVGAENIKKNIQETQGAVFKEPGLQLEAFFPLGFGGKKAKAFLRVYIERINGELGEKRPRAVYFVFNIETDKQGKLQWSIYLKERQIAIQVFSDFGTGEKDELKSLVASVEKSLRNRGFRLLAPTVYLKSFFRVPEGFRLNVKG